MKKLITTFKTTKNGQYYQVDYIKNLHEHYRVELDSDGESDYRYYYNKYNRLVYIEVINYE